MCFSTACTRVQSTRLGTQKLRPRHHPPPLVSHPPPVPAAFKSVTTTFRRKRRDLIRDRGTLNHCFSIYINVIFCRDPGTGGGTAASTSGAGSTTLWRGKPPPPPLAADGGATAASSSSAAGGRSSASPSSSEAWGRLRHGRWKHELRANSRHVPAVELARLADHT